MRRLKVYFYLMIIASAPPAGGAAAGNIDHPDRMDKPIWIIQLGEIRPLSPGAKAGSDFRMLESLRDETGFQSVNRRAWNLTSIQERLRQEKDRNPRKPPPIDRHTILMKTDHANVKPYRPRGTKGLMVLRADEVQASRKDGSQVAATKIKLERTTWANGGVGLKFKNEGMIEQFSTEGTCPTVIGSWKLTDGTIEIKSDGWRFAGTIAGDRIEGKGWVEGITTGSKVIFIKQVWQVSCPMSLPRSLLPLIIGLKAVP